MLVLALDTSSSAVCVAVHDGTDVVAEASEVAPRRHGELLAPMIGAVLGAAQVERGDGRLTWITPTGRSIASRPDP